MTWQQHLEEGRDAQIDETTISHLSARYVVLLRSSCCGRAAVVALAFAQHQHLKEGRDAQNRE